LLELALTTLLYAAMVLSMGDVRGVWRLGLAMLPALVLAVATLIIVVIFAHRMTQVMRADEMVARIGRQFVGDIHIILKPPAGCLLTQVDGDAFERELVDPTVILATQAGYVGTMTTAD
jgi:uncharacterized membrane protein